jgi:imidazolonepropionase-like amidohydrolase
VPTFSVLRKVVALDERRPGALPDYVPRKARELVDKQRRSFKTALELGVKIVLGTDAGGIERGRNADELAYMVEAGMTPMQAIIAGTSLAARCIGFGDELGVLEPGKLADLLIVEGDPLADVALLQDRERLRIIMQGGNIIKDCL